MLERICLRACVAVAATIGALSPALAQKNYGPGVSDTEIKIGNIMPYSGPASAYGAIGRTEAAYFKMINDQGGINGRKVNLIQYDDAYSPPKAVEQVRKLVESDEVLLTFQIVGTPSNAAVQKYLNARKVPQLLASTGASRFSDPQNAPWTIAFNPNYQSEGRIYAKYILANHPNAKIGIFYQNDDLGRDYIAGLRSGLGAKADSMIVAEASYELSDPTVDSQIVKLKSSGADLLYNASTPKFAAQAIKKVAEIGWKPTHFLNNVSASVGSVIKPAGFEAAQGIVSSQYLKDPTDPQWKTDKGMIAWNQFLDKYYPEANRADASVMYAYTVAQGLEHVLRACGDNLTRENIMKQAASLQDFRTEVLLPGIKINTAANDFAPISQLQLMKFKGDKWELFGEVISADVGG